MFMLTVDDIILRKTKQEIQGLWNYSELYNRIYRLIIFYYKKESGRCYSTLLTCDKKLFFRGIVWKKLKENYILNYR